jgi:hypothetical protein
MNFFFKISAFICCIVLCLEFILKLNGHQPGAHGVESVSQGIMFDSIPNFYTTDSFGIYKVNYDMSKELFASYDFCNRKIASNFDFDNLENIMHSSRCLQVDLNLLEDACQVCVNANEEYPFRYYLLESAKKGKAQYLKNYIEHPINEDGFRGISFQTNYDSLDKIKVLLIGDSYVWGLSSEPVFNSYSDILLSKDYIVFNAGIPGTDPAQYAAIAKKYIPILKPDIVIVNFYVANDFMFYPREAEVSEPLEYFTTSGFIVSSPAGDFLELDDLEKYYESLLQIPNDDESWFNTFCAKTRVGSSVLWPLFLSFDFCKHDALKAHHQDLDMLLVERAEISKIYTDDIALLARQYQVPLSFVVIPEVPFVLFDKTIFKNKGKNKEALDLVFGENGYDFPEIFCKKDNAQSGHFNNQGSVKFANYLDELIKKKLQNP